MSDSESTDEKENAAWHLYKLLGVQRTATTPEIKKVCV
jgi:curved DNA-binding protein CbpA